MSHLKKVPHVLADIMQAPVGSAERRAAIEEVINNAMKADTLDLLDRRGHVPAELSYRNNPEGELTPNGN